jgi:hypothetical protein
MHLSAKSEKFEEAAKLRDQITALIAIGSSQTTFSRQEEIEGLKQLLKLKRLPLRIEAFDISNITGKEACGSMVSFYRGLADKNNYRRFKIKTVEGIDDYKMMSEVVRRHECCEELALYFYRVDEPETERPVERTIEAIRAVGSIQFADNYGGCMSVRKKWLEAVNGYEADLKWRGYSAVDQDVARRLKALGLHIQWHPTKFLYHGYHPGCHKPDSGSLERTYIQTRIFQSRARALQTLPDKGLDPARKPANSLSTTVGRDRHWLGRAVRRLLPYRLRRRLSSMLTE